MKDEAMKLALEALEKLQWSLEQADCSTGYCCCGSSVDGHAFGDGHSPVDEGEYCQSNALECARKAITAIKQARSAPVQEPVAWRWSESNGEHWFGWTTDWSHHDKAKSMAVPIEYAYTTPPAQEFVCSTGLCHYKADKENT